MSIDILYIRPGGSGWGPVAQLAMLTAKVLGGRLAEVEDTGRASMAQRVSLLLPRGPRRRGRRLLVIAGNPAALALAARPSMWWPGYDSTAAWVIDSFWTDRIARIARHRPHLDHLFITDPNLAEEWRSATGRPVDVLPWGADTLAFPDAAAPRPVDLLRLGRQPAAWEDDNVTGAEAADHGVVFEGRPPASPTPEANQAAVRDALARARLVLAFSNRVSPAPYTHPTREYLTGRWMDSLAAGCLVAGTAPSTATDLLWPGATLEISPNDRAAAWPMIAAAAAAWTPEQAAIQQDRARATVDWRWRLVNLCRILGWDDAERRAAKATRSLDLSHH
ncbi:glycosyltransferase [Micrococcus luteus]|uniref:glycosyltransferase n=1 Tax=Micrococcus luteus TaxID=1270 RepID=UPI003D70ED49